MFYGVVKLFNLSRYFKRSKDRCNKEEEFLAINLHHQNFDVDGKNYRSTTCGAAAAHTRGFSQKGLWNILGVESAAPIDGLGKFLHKQLILHGFKRVQGLKSGCLVVWEFYFNISQVAIL